MIRKIVIVACCFLCAALVLSCSDLQPTAASSVNPQITGRIFAPDGKNPASGAIIQIGKRCRSFDSAAVGLQKKASGMATVVADNFGVYVIDSINPGTYVLNVSDRNNNRALIDSIVIIASEKNKWIQDDTLKSAGAIRGNIRLGEGGDPRKIVIINYQLNRMAQVNADGSFLLCDLAKGRYDLRFLPSLDGYSIFDTAKIIVTPGDTADLGIISPHFVGIPTPRNVRLTYDCLKEIVTLTWSISDTGLVKGYNVYRRRLDSNSTFGSLSLNGAQPVKTGEYHDSSVMQDRPYEYKVVAVDKEDNAGLMSDGVRVKTTSAFYISDSLIPDDRSWCIAKYPPIFQTHRQEWIVGSEFKLFKISSTGKTLAIWLPAVNDPIANQIGGNPLISGIDDSDNILSYGQGYQYNPPANYIIRNNVDGSAQWIFSMTQRAKNLCVHKNTIFILDENNIITAFSFKGDSLRSWGGIGTGPGKFGRVISIGANHDGRIFVCDLITDHPQDYSLDALPTRIQSFSPEGAMLSSFYIPAPYFSEPFCHNCHYYLAGINNMSVADSMIIVTSLYNAYGFDFQGNLTFRFQLDERFFGTVYQPYNEEEGINTMLIDKSGAMKIVMKSAKFYTIAKR
jgi:hypothetical protein